MIANLKITDGDLLIIHLEGENVSSSYIESVRAKMSKYVQARGLNNVEIMVSGGDVKMSITRVTVNDVFEDKVLKGE